jgi:hypothetical protein
MIVSEILRQSSIDLDIAVLHPGGGQYDTLSLVSYEGHSLVHINRNGVNALANDEIVENIFDTAAKSPYLAAKRILKALEVLPFSGHSLNSRRRFETAVRISNYLAFYLSSNTRCEWGWFDSPYDVGPNELISMFKIPEPWKKIKGLFKDTSWESSIFLLLKGDLPLAAINIATGESVDRNGERLVDNVKNFSDDGMLRSHIGAYMIAKDSSNIVRFEDEVHIANLRMSRRIYSEEYLTIPEERIIFEFSCDERESVRKWNEAEQFFSREDLENLS